MTQNDHFSWASRWLSLTLITDIYWLCAETVVSIYCVHGDVHCDDVLSTKTVFDSLRFFISVFRVLFPYGIYHRVGRMRKWDKHRRYRRSWPFLFLRTPNNVHGVERWNNNNFCEMRTSRSIWCTTYYSHIGTHRMRERARANRIERQPREVGVKIIDK